jgi:hypothetical protein
MTQSERENRKPSSFFLFWFRSDPARRAPRKRDTNLQRFGHLARPGPDGLKRESVSKPVSKPVSFLRARSISLSKTKSRSSPRVEF